MRRLLARTALLWLSAGTLAAQPADAERTAWRYRRLVRAEGTGELLALALPPEVTARAQHGLKDLRLVNPSGQELAYLVDRTLAREVRPSFSGRLLDTRREIRGPQDDERGLTVFVVDLDEPRTFDRIGLQIAAQDFAARVRVEAADDSGGPWRLLDGDAGVFDGIWGARVHHTTIALEEPVTARFLRLSLGDRRGVPAVRVSGVTVSAVRSTVGQEWRRPVGLQAVPGARTTRYRIADNLPLESLELDSDDPAFSRRVQLVEVSERGGRRQETVLGEALLYRLRLPEPGLVGEARVLPLRAAPLGGELFLEVEDGDSPPLRGPRGVAFGTAVRVVFAAAASPLVLYYGNETTRAPLYDLGGLEEQIRFASGLGTATLGEETENPLYRKPEPIPFVAVRGQKVEAERWMTFRRLLVQGPPDICALTLGPDDVAVARPDLGDLRLVAEDGSQVPYLLESGPSGTVALEVEAEPERPGERGTVSPYGLRVPGLTEGASGMPLLALELEIAEAFFERPARVMAPPPLGAAQPATLYAGTLSRRPAFSGGQGREGRLTVVPLGGTRVRALTLEISDGDDARLTVTSVRGRVPLPRLVFKATPGAYRALVGNPEAAAPRYDLVSLRQEVLAYSARPVEADAPQANPAFRRSAREYFRAAPPTAFLWGALIVAVAGLLFLTARVLREPKEPPAG
jgi:hypothetical protein